MAARADQLRRELAEIERREQLAKLQCTDCGGKGWFSDTTYNRTGEDVSCGRCHGSGLPKDQVDSIIREAFAPFRKPVGDRAALPAQEPRHGRD